MNDKFSIEISSTIVVESGRQNVRDTCCNLDK